MRILTLYIENSDSMYGGAYRRYMELINGLLKDGHEIHHISPKGFKNIRSYNFYHHGVYQIPLKPSYLPFMLQVVPMSIILGIKYKIDVVVTFSLLDALIGITFRFFHRKTKIVFCERGNVIKGMEIFLQTKKHDRLLSFMLWALKKIEKLVYQSADLIIFNSNIRKEEIKKSYHMKNYELIYNNANPSWVENKIEEARIKAEDIKIKYMDYFIICFIGNLFLAGRDIHTLLRSFKKINTSIPNTMLLMVGDGPDKLKIKEIIKNLNLDNHVIMKGWQNNPLTYMIASKINVVTALHEGCSNTVLESIYCEAVTLGTKVSGIEVLLKYDELLFPPLNEDIIVDKILKLLNDKGSWTNAKKLIKNRKNKFVFDWKEKMSKTITYNIEHLNEN